MHIVDSDCYSPPWWKTDFLTWLTLCLWAFSTCGPRRAVRVQCSQASWLCFFPCLQCPYVSCLQDTDVIHFCSYSDVFCSFITPQSFFIFYFMFWMCKVLTGVHKSKLSKKVISDWCHSSPISFYLMFHDCRSWFFFFFLMWYSSFSYFCTKDSTPLCILSSPPHNIVEINLILLGIFLILFFRAAWQSSIHWSSVNAIIIVCIYFVIISNIVLNSII